MRPVAIWVLILAASGVLAQESDLAELRRPLDLPKLSASAVCPASIGTVGVVPSQPHIFGAWPGAVWFGTGPVYFKGWSNDEAAIFQRIIRSGSTPTPFTFGFKTPVVSDISYSGPILLRGRDLESGRQMTFSGSRDELVLSGPWGHLRASTGNPDDWRFWPTTFEMPEPGCYGVQIDTLIGTEVLIVEALPNAFASEEASSN